MFLNYLLCLCLALVLLLYLYQFKYSHKKNKHNNNILSPIALPIIHDTCNKNRKSGMPVHHVGPVLNFHQKFSKCDNNNEYGCIPELGWRNFYINKFNTNEVKHEDSFDGTIVRNFLNQLENVDNIYRKCC